MVTVTNFVGNRNAGDTTSLAQYYGAQTSTNFDVISENGNPRQSFIGHDFRYSSNGFVSSGVIESMIFYNADGSIGTVVADATLNVTDYLRLLSIGTSSYTFWQFLYRGNDTFTGSDFADSFDGSDGKDRFDGGGGVDLLTFARYHTAVAIDLAAGTAVTASGTSRVIRIEDATGTAFADTLTGNTLDNELQGMGGADRINGGKGFDTARYSDAHAGITVDLAAGTALADNATDTLTSIERIIGSRFADTLKGSQANESFLGGLGNDTIDGGAGRDRVEYDLSAGAVQVSLKQGTSAGAAGADVLRNIEDVSGSVFGDRLTGNNAANALDGRSGDDILAGGGGADTLTGGTGDDRFVYAAAADSVGAKGTDTITDFQAGDRIDLSLIDANPGTAGNQAFRFVGAAAFSGAAGEIRVVASGGDAVVSGDIDGDRQADFQIRVADHAPLIAGDFIL